MHMGVMLCIWIFLCYFVYIANVFSMRNLLVDMQIGTVNDYCGVPIDPKRLLQEFSNDFL